MKRKICTIWNIRKKMYSYGFMLPIILLFALLGCGGQTEYIDAEYTEYHSEEAPPANIEAVGFDVAVVDTGTSEAETPETYISAEATEPAFDISLLVLREIVYRDGLIQIQDNDGRGGLLDGMGNLLLPLQRNVTFGRYGEGRIFVTTREGSGFVDTSTGEWAIPPYFADEHRSGAFRYGVATVWLDGGRPTGRRGVINHDGEWIFGPVPRGARISGQAHHGLILVSPYSFQAGGNSAWVSMPDEESVLIFGENVIPFLMSVTGERVFPLEHMEIYHRIHRANSNISVIDENLLKIRIGAYIGFFDLDGNEIVYFVDDEFNWMDAFARNDVIYAYYTDVLCQTWVDPTIQYRAFDIQGNEITNRYYTNMGGFSEGFASVQIGYPSYDWETAQSSDDLNWDSVFWGLIDKQGNEVIPTIHRYVSGVIHGRAQVLTTSGLALFNTAGEVVIPPGVYNSFTICDQGIIITGTSDASTLPSNQLQGLVDLDGNEIIPPRYNIIRNYWMSNPDRYSFLVALNHVGSWELPIAYPTFVEGRAAVAYDGLWGYIDMNGYEVIPLQFMYVGTFIDGMALVNIGGTRVRTQPHTWQSERDPIPFIRNYSAYGGTWHLIDLYGNIIETFEHEFMKRINANILAFSNDISLSEIYDRHGNTCVYISLLQMDIKNLGIFVIEPPPITEILYHPVFTQVQYLDGFVYVREERLGQDDGQAYILGGLLDDMGNELIALTQDLSFRVSNPFRHGIGQKLSEGIIIATTLHGYGFMDAFTGEWVAHFPDGREESPFLRRINLLPFAYGVAVVHPGNPGDMGISEMGVINSNGEWVFEMTRGYISPQFRYGLAVVQQGIRYDDGEFAYWRLFVINTDGEIVFPLPHMAFYSYVGDIEILSANLLSVRLDPPFIGAHQMARVSHQVVFDLNGNEFFHPLRYFNADLVQEDAVWDIYYSHIGRFSEGYAPFRMGYFRWMGVNMYTTLHPLYTYAGLVDEHGRVVIQPQYENIGHVIHERMIAIVQNDERITLFALLDTSGEHIIPAGRFQGIWICTYEPVAIVATEEREGLRQYGIVDLYGNYIIPPRYDIIRHYGVERPQNRAWGAEPEYNPIFIEGRAAVAYGGLWGYVDTTGYEIIPPQFVYAGTFINGVALVNYGGNWQLIDLYNNILESFEHEFMARISANLLTFAEDERKGIIRITL